MDIKLNISFIIKTNYKQMKKYIILFTALLSVTFSSCSEWFDVNASDKIKQEELFADQTGYYEALTGIYLLCGEDALWGRRLSFYIPELVTKQYDLMSNTTMGYFYDCDYEASAAETIIDGVWSQLYYVIANCNNMYQNLMESEIEFTSDNKEILEAELYALRAYLHFEVLRLFAPSPAAEGGLDQLAIPYYEEIAYVANEQLTIGETLDKILADLFAAKELLDVHDPLITGTSSSDAAWLVGDVFYDNLFREYRGFRMNYISVTALIARAYLYQGDTVNAYKYALEALSYTTETDFSSGYYWYADNLTSFYVDTDDYYSSNGTYFQTGSNYICTIASETTRNNLYENDSYPLADVRRTYDWGLLDGYTSTVPTKLFATSRVKAVITRAELLLIVAETAADNGDDPLTYLNQQRYERGLELYPLTSTETETVAEEIRKEYMKEFLCEGDLFYYYKRLNTDTFSSSSGMTVSDFSSKNTLPIPDDEYYYGNIAE